LEEKIDDLEARLKTLEKKEGQIRDKLEESQKKIQGSLGQ
jgi:chaperonin cofactor prefoldin